MAAEKLIIRISATGGASVARESSVAATGLSALGVKSEKVNSAAQAAFDRQKQSAQELVSFVKKASLITGGAAIAAVGYGVKLNATWQSNEAALATLLGSMKKAKDFTEELRQVSNKSPLRLTEWQEGAKQLLGYGMNAKRVLPTLNAINKAVVTMGKSEADMRGIVLAIGQIQTKGRVQGDELLQLAERGIPAYQILKEELGLTAVEVQNIGKQGISADKVISALNRGLEKRYGEGYRRAASTFNFQFASAKKGAEQLLRIVSEPVFDALSTTILPAVNQELGVFIKTLDDPRMSGQEKVEKLGHDFEALLGKLGDVAEDGLPKVFDAIEKLLPHAVAVIRQLTPEIINVIGEIAKGAVATAGTAGPQIALALVEGFLEADVWGKLVVGAWLFSKLGGFAALTTAGLGPGTIVAGGFRKGFESGMAAFNLAQSFGRGKGASGAAGLGAMGWELGSSLLMGLKRALPVLAVTFGISETLSKVMAGDISGALEKAAGLAVGGGIGFLVGGPVGAAIGAGIGTALSGTVADLFGGESDPVKTLEQRIQQGLKRLPRMVQASTAAISAYENSSKGFRSAQNREKRAADAVKKAEQAAARARRRYGQDSDEAARANARLAVATDKATRAAKRAKTAERLQGVERQASKVVLREQVRGYRDLIQELQKKQQRTRQELRDTPKTAKNAEKLEGLLKTQTQTTKQLNRVRGQMNKTVSEAAQKISPQFAKSLQNVKSTSEQVAASLKKQRTFTQNLNQSVLNIKPSWEKAGNSATTFSTKTKTATKSAGDKTRDFGVTVRNTRKSVAGNWSAMAQVQDVATDDIITDTKDSLGALQNLGPVQKKRAGGLIRYIQSFNKGGVPVALSSGEVFKTPDGKWGRVPGRPVAADNVLTTMPVDTKIFTWDGQRRLIEGASETEALAKQASHFADGGIVKPTLSGGTPKAKEIGNKSIDKVHSAAVAKLKRAKEAEAAASVGGVSGSMQGGISEIVARILAQFPGLVVTSTTGGTHATNSLHYQGRAADIASGDYGLMNQAAEWIKTHIGTSLTEGIHNPNLSIKYGHAVDPSYWGADTWAGHANHIHVAKRHGGIIRALQALYTGGQVRVVKNVGQYLLNKGFDFRATAGILGNAYREALPPWNPASVGTGGGGLWGFTTPPISLADLQNYASSKGKPWDDELLQAQFMLIHGGMALKGKLNAADKISDTARIFMEDWERPGVPALSDRQHGGYEAAKILQDAGIVKAGDEGLSDRERERREKRHEMAGRREARERQIKKLRAMARSTDSAARKKALLWQAVEMYAKWGDFDIKPLYLAGGVGPGRNEKQHLLTAASRISSIANPNRGAGQLYELMGWLEQNVNITGREDEDKALVNRLERTQTRGGKVAKRRRKHIYSQIANLGEDFRFTGPLSRIDRKIKIAGEYADIAEAKASSEAGPGGSELTDAELANLIGLYTKVKDNQVYKRNVLGVAIPYAEDLLKTYRADIERVRKDPSKRWQIPGYKRGLSSTRSRLQTLREARETLIGVTGQGGELLDTKLRLAELGVSTTVEKQQGENTSALLQEQLTNAQRELALRQSGTGIFSDWLQDLKREIPPFAGFFSAGGVVPGPVGAARHAVVHGGEEIIPAGGGNAPLVNVYVDPVSLDTRVETIVDGTLRKQVFRATRTVPQGGRLL